MGCRWWGRYEKYVRKDEDRMAAASKGPDAFMDEYAFIMGQADELTTVKRLPAASVQPTLTTSSRICMHLYIKKLHVLFCRSSDNITAAEGAEQR